MNEYTAKYYPMKNGKVCEYTTTVRAKNKVAAEAAIRRALVAQLERMQHMIDTFHMAVVGYDMDRLPKEIDYAKNGMRVVILQETNRYWINC